MGTLGIEGSDSRSGVCVCGCWHAGSDVAVVECPGGPGRVVTSGTADANLHVEDSVIQILEPGMCCFRHVADGSGWKSAVILSVWPKRETLEGLGT